MKNTHSLTAAVCVCVYVCVLHLLRNVAGVACALKEEDARRLIGNARRSPVVCVYVCIYVG